MTPYTWRNFTNAGSMARKDWFFCGILYAWGGPRSIERCKKHGAPPKKIVFPRPICHFPSLSWKVAATFQAKLNLSWKVAATNRDKLRIQWNKQVFCRFYKVFRPIFCFRRVFMYMTRIFKKDIGPSLLFLASETTDTKFRRSTGVTTANSTNKHPNENKLSWVIN